MSATSSKASLNLRCLAPIKTIHMPFNVSAPAASPNPISLPGSSTISCNVTGTAGITIQVDYLLSSSNNIVFSSGGKTQSGGTKVLTGGTDIISQKLNFAQTGNNQQASFFVTVRVTNVSNGATKSPQVQIQI